MKAEYFRLGNIVLFNERQFNVVGIGNDRLILSQGNSETWQEAPLHQIKPIKLTTEWLVKLGLKKHGDRWYFSFYEDLETNRFLRKETYNSRWDDKERGWLVIGSWEGFNDVPIKHVHQLQNTYFALTGTELTLKP